MPDGGGHGQDALSDAGAEAGDGASAVLLEVELALEGVVDGLDDLAHGFEELVPWPGLFTDLSAPFSGCAGNGGLRRFLTGRRFSVERTFGPTECGGVTGEVRRSPALSGPTTAEECPEMMLAHPAPAADRAVLP